MSFVLSKLAWLVLQPSNLLLLGLLVAVLLNWRRLMLALMALLDIVAVLPVGLWLQRPRERFARPTELPAEIAGIIVLGGAQDQAITEARGTLALTDAAERMVEGLALAYRYPEGAARLQRRQRSPVSGGGQRGRGQRALHRHDAARPVPRPPRGPLAQHLGECPLHP